MGHRAYLSKKIVDGARAPAKGERWISDTELRGFGLRVWRSPDGASKSAFAIRTITADGNPKRETLPKWRCRELHREEEPSRYWDDRFHSPTIGDLTEVARRLARDRIDSLKGRPTLQEEDEAEQERVRRRVGNYKFRKAAEIVVRNLRAADRSKEYCDRLDKLFHLHVPKALQSKALVRVTKGDISRVLSRRSLSAGNMRVLRPFIGKCLDLASSVGLRSKARSHQLRGLVPTDRDRPSEIHLRRWSPKRIDTLRGYLRDQREYWQQASCFEVFLETEIPLSILLRAKVTELFDVTRRRDDVEWSLVQLQLGESRKHRARVDGRVLEILEECDRRRSEDFPESEYFFPSPTRRGDDHIASCDYIWSCLQREFALNDLTPRKFRKIWFEATFTERFARAAMWRRDLRRIAS